MTPLSLKQRLLLISQVCRAFRTLDQEDSIQESWIATRHLSQPSLIKLKTKQRCIDLWRQDRAREKRVLTNSEIVEYHLEQQETQNLVEAKQTLAEIIDSTDLSDLQRDLLYRRYYKSQTLREISQDLNLTLSRSHQEITDAETKLKETIK